MSEKLNNHDLAEKITAAIFTDAQGVKVDRIALDYNNVPGDHPKDFILGYGREVVLEMVKDILNKALTANEEQP